MAWNDFGYLLGVLLVSYIVLGLGLGFVRLLKISKEKKHTAFFYLWAAFMLGVFVYYAIFDQNMQTAFRAAPLLFPLYLLVLVIFGLIVYYTYKWNKLAFYIMLLFPLAVVLREVYTLGAFTSLYNGISTGIDYDALFTESMNSLYMNTFFLGVVYGAKEKFLK